MKVLLWFLAATSLVACLDGGLRFYVSFHASHGLESGSPVWMAGKQVGVVEEVVQEQEGSWKVAVRIDRKYRDQVTVGSRFSVEPDPQRSDRYLLRIDPDPRGQPVEEEQVVVGSEPVPGFLRPLIQGLSEGLEDLERQLELFHRELEQLPHSPGFQQLQRRMQELARQMREAEETLQYQMLPELQREMERLQRELEKIQPGRPGERPGTQPISL